MSDPLSCWNSKIRCIKHGSRVFCLEKSKEEKERLHENSKGKARNR